MPVGGGTPLDKVIEAAAAATAAGTWLITVGLGQVTDVWPDLLARVASGPENYMLRARRRGPRGDLPAHRRLHPGLPN
jgi:hypothetical protein